MLFTSTKEVTGRWKEHFGELLDPTNPPSRAELEDDGEPTSISLDEVAEVVKKLHSSKAPGIDEIHPKMLKTLGVRLSWVTRLLNIAWKSGPVPKEWQMGVVAPLFKKGTTGCGPTIGASHYSAYLGKSTPRCWKGGSGR